MEQKSTMIADLWAQLTGRQRVLQFHLGNVSMTNLSWSELSEGQREIILNAGRIIGLDRSRRPDPTSFS